MATASDKTIDEAIVAALGEFTEVPKDQTAKAGTFSYSYADLGSVLSYVRPILAKHGLVVMQPVTSTEHEVAVETIILHTSGQTRHHGNLTMPRGQTPQQTGSAITYARRYSLLSTLGLATADDDGKEASRAKPRTKPEAKPNSAARKVVYNTAGQNVALASQWWADGASNLGKGPDDELTPQEADQVIEHAKTMAESQVKLEVVPAKDREGLTKARRAAKQRGALDTEHWEGKAASEGVDPDPEQLVADELGGTADGG